MLAHHLRISADVALDKSQFACARQKLAILAELQPTQELLSSHVDDLKRKSDWARITKIKDPLIYPTENLSLAPPTASANLSPHWHKYCCFHILAEWSARTELLVPELSPTLDQEGKSIGVSYLPSHRHQIVMDVHGQRSMTMLLQ